MSRSTCDLASAKYVSTKLAKLLPFKLKKPVFPTLYFVFSFNIPKKSMSTMQCASISICGRSEGKTSAAPFRLPDSHCCQDFKKIQIWSNRSQPFSRSCIFYFYCNCLSGRQLMTHSSGRKGHWISVRTGFSFCPLLFFDDWKFSWVVFETGRNRP